MKKDSKILILGGRGLVGSAIARELKAQNYTNVLTPFRDELDLTVQAQVLEYFAKHNPEYVFMAAAKVGGIVANNEYRADFIFQNLAIQNNVFEASFKSKIKRMLFLGSSCIYPKLAPQPLKEEYLLTGPLEETNEPYAIAKIAGLKTAESFRRQYGCEFYSVMPTNLYGPYDNFDPKNSHVIPGLIRRMCEAKDRGDKTFEVWGTGTPRREFLYVEDMARACLYVMNFQGEMPDLINIGCGEDITIKDLAEIIKEKVGYKGEIIFNPKFPDGTPRKLLDVSRIKNLGWQPTVSLPDGIERAVNFFRSQI